MQCSGSSNVDQPSIIKFRHGDGNIIWDGDELLNLSLEHSVENKDEEEEEEITAMQFFDQLDCSGDSLKRYVDEPCSGSSNMGHGATLVIKHDSSPSIMNPESCACNIKHGALTPEEEVQLQWELKAVKALNIVRRRGLTECNADRVCVRTRFYEFNIAFFDHDKESEIKHETPFCKIHPSRYRLLDGSVNIISIKIAMPNVPINIYGTVLARDCYDYRSVYLFKRGRDNPQHMNKKNRKLALIGPYRALGGTGSIYFEFHLKIKGKAKANDRDFCKGLLERNPFRFTPAEPCTYSLKRCPSTVDIVCMPVQRALEASLQISILNGKSFFSKISAWTSGNDQNKSILGSQTEIILYDSKVAGTQTKLGRVGSVPLSRHIVAVPLHGRLLLKFSIWENNKPKHLDLILRHDVEDSTCELGPYELQVKIIWSGVFRQRPPQDVEIHRGQFSFLVIPLSKYCYSVYTWLVYVYFFITHLWIHYC
ncbi:unnamed protein product [Urochloa humidicola]